MPIEDETPVEKSASDSEKFELAFSSRPPESSGDTDAAEQAPVEKKNTGMLIAAVVGALLISVAGFFIWQSLQTKDAPKKVEAVAEKAKPAVETPEQRYESLSKKIDDEFVGSKASPKLLELALLRLSEAKQIGDSEKICKSADFAAAMSDGLGMTPQALALYDLHNLVKPNQNVLEAKFRIYRRLSMIPSTPEEQQLYNAFVNLERAEDQLSSEMTVLDDDYYSQLLHLNKLRKEQMNAYEKSNLSYNDLLKSWFLNKSALHLMSMVLSKQNGGALRSLDLSIDQMHPEQELQRIDKWTDFENTNAYGKQKWYLLENSPERLAYLSTDKKTLMVLKLTEEQYILSARIISLSACSGANFPESLFELASPLVFGFGADEIPESAQILKAATIALSKYGYKYDWNTLQPLFSKENLVGLEVRRIPEVDWSKDPSIDQELSLLPKEHAVKTKYGPLSYLESLANPKK